MNRMCFLRVVTGRVEKTFFFNITGTKQLVVGRGH